jgi:hypothetical protein
LVLVIYDVCTLDWLKLDAFNHFQTMDWICMADYCAGPAMVRVCLVFIWLFAGIS